MRTSMLASIMCVTVSFNVLADEQLNSTQLVDLVCVRNHCEHWDYNAAAKMSSTTNCATQGEPSELWFPPQNGTHVIETPSMNAKRVIEVTDTAVKITLTIELSGYRKVMTTMVSRIDGKYNEIDETYAKWGTDRYTISGTCIAASGLEKRKF